MKGKGRVLTPVVLTAAVYAISHRLLEIGQYLVWIHSNVNNPTIQFQSNQSNIPTPTWGAFAKWALAFTVYTGILVAVEDTEYSDVAVAMAWVVFMGSAVYYKDAIASAFAAQGIGVGNSGGQSPAVGETPTQQQRGHTA